MQQTRRRPISKVVQSDPRWEAMKAFRRNLDADDAVDFLQMVTHSTDEGQQPIDLETLEALGEMVWPGGGGEEILRLTASVKEGGVIDVNALLRRH